MDKLNIMNIDNKFYFKSGVKYIENLVNKSNIVGVLRKLE